MQLFILGRVLITVGRIIVPVAGLGAILGILAFKTAIIIAIICLVLILIGTTLKFSNRKT